MNPASRNRIALSSTFFPPRVRLVSPREVETAGSDCRPLYSLTTLANNDSPLRNGASGPFCADRTPLSRKKVRIRNPQMRRTFVIFADLTVQNRTAGIIAARGCEFRLRSRFQLWNLASSTPRASGSLRAHISLNEAPP